MPISYNSIKVRVGVKSPLLRALLIVAATLSVSAPAFAAGLGRLQVQSALGAPFRAEINVIADKNELSSLAAKMAAAGAFQNAGLVYNSATAAMRVALDKRANGEMYVSITTAEPLNEPVVDLLIELSWASGRVIREYTAFVDPPFLIAEREKQRAAAAAAQTAPTTKPAPPQEAPKPEALPAEPAPQPEAPAAASEPIPTTSTDVTEPTAAAEDAPAAESAPAAAPPEPPVQTIGGTGPTLFDAQTQTSTVAGESYGPTKSGDTLSKIALSAKPADITLEQMLVLLFRSNPDAFAGKNMNRLKTGKIIRLPDASEYAGINAAAARREVRVQSANWRAYRERLAAASAPTAQEPAQQSASGQITPKVEERAAPGSEPKEVVKLSQAQSAPAAGAAGGKVEEEVVARDKAVREANERVAKLEKSVKDLQSLVEMKNQQMAELQRQAAGAPGVAPQPPKPAATTPAPAASTSPLPSTTKPSTPQGSAPTAAAPPSVQPAPPVQQTPPAAPPASVRPQAGPPPATPHSPQVQRRPPPPPPPPSLVDRIMAEPLYLGAGGLLVVVVGLLAVRGVRRRREAKSQAEEVAPATFASAGATVASTFAPAQTDVGTRSRDIAEEVDPLEEAEIFLAYGREAQAEELLKEAMLTHPRRQEVQLKLLEIFAKRQDTTAFEQLARELQQSTGGRGEIWDRAVQLGYELDPDNPRYAAGREAQPAAHDTAEPGPAERLDFDVGLGDAAAASNTSTDIDLDQTSHFEKTQIFSIDQLGSTSGTEPTASNVDLNIDLPADAPGASEPAAANAGLEFDFDISKAAVPEPGSAAAPAAEQDAGLDFDIAGLSLESGETQPGGSAPAPAIDLSGISLDLDGAATSPSAASIGKDEKWYEVQTKFDLAKAYHEMGDKEGAREILKEVLAEGDADQKAAAQAVLTSLD